jgi:hypothetical protein
MKQGISPRIKRLTLSSSVRGLASQMHFVGVCDGDMKKLGTEVNPEEQYDDTHCTLCIFTKLPGPFDPDALPATCSRNARNRFAQRYGSCHLYP